MFPNLWGPLCSDQHFPENHNKTRHFYRRVVEFRLIRGFTKQYTYQSQIIALVKNARMCFPPLHRNGIRGSPAVETVFRGSPAISLELIGLMCMRASQMSSGSRRPTAKIQYVGFHHAQSFVLLNVSSPLPTTLPKYCFARKKWTILVEYIYKANDTCLENLTPWRSASRLLILVLFLRVRQCDCAGSIGSWWILQLTLCCNGQDWGELWSRPFNPLAAVVNSDCGIRVVRLMLDI